MVVFWVFSYFVVFGLVFVCLFVVFEVVEIGSFEDWIG